MLRALSLYLSNWPVDMTRRRDRSRSPSQAPFPSPFAPRDEPLLLVQTIRQRPVVVACCERARVGGVCVGMSVADARALLKSDRVRIEAARPDRDAMAFASLARWAVLIDDVATTKMELEPQL